MDSIPVVVDNSGPSLFTIRFTDFVRWNQAEPYFSPIDPDESEDWIEPPDPPEFLFGHLPEQVAKKIIATGYWDWEYLLEEGVEELYWRQASRHIEEGLVSEDVFNALKSIAPGSVYSAGTFRIHPHVGREGPRTYYRLRVHSYPRADANPEEIAERRTLIEEACSPPLEPGEAAFQNTRFSEAPNPVQAYASWAARDDKILKINGQSWVVTEGFKRQWLETGISQYLRTTNREHDLDFIPSNGGGWGGDYRWVDVD